MAPSLPPLHLVADRMRQVFLNLLLNAIEAMPDGGNLQISTARTNQPDGVRIVFKDSGTGISPEVLPRIFEPFHTDKADGLGLGLYVSQKIVQEHNGHIEVESKVGQGSTFIVWLPD